MADDVTGQGAQTPAVKEKKKSKALIEVKLPKAMRKALKKGLKRIDIFGVLG